MNQEESNQNIFIPKKFVGLEDKTNEINKQEIEQSFSFKIAYKEEENPDFQLTGNEKISFTPYESKETTPFQLRQEDNPFQLKQETTSFQPMGEDNPFQLKQEALPFQLKHEDNPFQFKQESFNNNQESNYYSRNSEDFSAKSSEDLQNVNQNIKRLETLLVQSLQNQGVNDGDEFLNQFRANNLNLAKLTKSIQILESKATSHNDHKDTDDMLNQLRTNNLYLSKLERQVQQLQATQNSNVADETLEISTHLKTNNLYLSKLERKIDQVQHTQAASHSNTQTDELMNQLRTNNLYLSKLERKMELIQATIQTKGDSDLTDQLRTNNLFLSKLERRVNELSHVNQNTSNAGTDHSVMAQLMEKMDRILEKREEESQMLKKMMEDLESQKMAIKSIEENNAQRNNSFDNNALSEGMNGEALTDILTKIMANNQNATVVDDQGNEVLLKNIKTNNLYLSSIGHKIDELLGQLGKINNTD